MRSRHRFNQTKVPVTVSRQIILLLTLTLTSGSIGALSAQSVNPLRITEFLASNANGLADGEGSRPDWIELWNSANNPINTAGLYLTDDMERPRKWPIPAMAIPGGGYVVVFASRQDRTAINTDLHTNFRLNKDAGGFLALTQVEGGELLVLSQFVAYPKQQTDISYGLSRNDAGIIRYFTSPTPGAPNPSSGVEGFVEDTRFSIDRGFFTEPFTVEVTCMTPGASLVYTTDGSLPTERHGTRVAPGDETRPPHARLTIDTTTSVRVMAFKAGFESSNVDTQTYIFPDEVLQQDDTFHAIGNSVAWGHEGPDWEMDRRIVTHANAAIRPESSDLLRLATVSLSLDFNTLFGRGGIYIAGQSVERDTSIEFLHPELAPDLEVHSLNSFQTDGTVQIVGGSSPNRWKTDKLSLRLKFPQDLRYPVFGPHAANRFDTLVLDARLNNVWHYGGGVEPIGQRERAQYVRDQYTANLQRALGGHAPHGRHVHLYLNGIYWGIHTLHERPDDNFAASYLGGDNNDFDVIKHSPSDVIQGSAAAYQRLHTLASQVNGNDDAYRAVTELLDIADFQSYMLVNYFVGNTDWAHHNWYASFNREASDGRWRFHSWDAEKGLHNVNDDRTGRNDAGGPTRLHHELMNHPEYRLQFADAAYQVLHLGSLSPIPAAEAYRNLTDTIDLPIRVESARWGDNQRSPAYHRLDWLETRARLLGEETSGNHPLNNYFSRRSNIVWNQFARRGWLPELAPPTLNSSSRLVESGFEAILSTNTGGIVYFTRDDSDPRDPGRLGDRTDTELISEGARKRAWLPTDNTLEPRWHQPSFDDSDWPTGRRGAGYDNNDTYRSFIDSNLNFGDQVSSTENESLYLRATFETSSSQLRSFTSLTLLMRYDDGFVAYLNGTEVARANSSTPNNRPGSFTSPATQTHSDSEAVIFQPFDISNHRHLLQAGSNTLAIHGLNSGPSSSDFLIWPMLRGSTSIGGAESGVSSSAQVYQQPILIDSPTRIKARVRRNNEWSALLQAEFLPDTDLPSPENLHVTRLHYHPTDPTPQEIAAGFAKAGDFEFLELTNPTPRSVRLTGARFSAGIRFEFPSQPAVIPAESSLILAANPAAYQFRYGSAEAVLGPFARETQLSDAGERITLEDAAGEILLTFTYQDDAPWPESADGQGDALQLNATATPSDFSDATAWHAVVVDRRPFHAAIDEITFRIRHDQAAGAESLRLEITLPLNLDPATWNIESSLDLRNWATWPQSDLTHYETTPTNAILVVPLASEVVAEANAYYFRLGAQDEP